MKIIFCPSFTGHTHLNLEKTNVRLATQTLDTQGLLQQLALHAGIHLEIPPYAKRLASYHASLMEYDHNNPENTFHRSIEIDSMSVAKTLMGWRDTLTLAGWNRKHTNISSRLDSLAAIEAFYADKDQSLAILLHRLVGTLQLMVQGGMNIPNAYRQLEVDVVCPKDLLPDYLKPVFDLLEQLAKNVTYSIVRTTDRPKHLQIIEFTDLYKAEAWLSQQNANAYDVWLNSNNKRLDNWLHMTGKAVGGSDMANSNPQITQMFLLAIQLFQRPLNVNTLLQYLYLPECPLKWKFTSRLTSSIVSEGGFSGNKVLKCVKDYLDNEFIQEGDGQISEYTQEERKKGYHDYLPFDFLNENDVSNLVKESNDIDIKRLRTFLENIKSYTSNRAVRIMKKKTDDLRVSQLQDVASLIENLLEIIENADTIKFPTLLQWAQSLYHTSNHRQYSAQIGCRNIICSPADMAEKAANSIWCDFYGDVDTSLETDFLSPREMEALFSAGIRIWNKDRESAYHRFIVEMPIHQTTDQLTFVVCKRRGTDNIPIHPLRLQLPADIEVISGDDEFGKLPSRKIDIIDNHREQDDVAVCFDARKHPVSWRNQESHSSLSSLLQNPLDYFMKYILGFSDKGPTEISMSITLGNVAHETIEQLFTTHKGENLVQEVCDAYDAAFANALSKKGAILLMPEHHLELNKLRYQLKRCVRQLAEIIVRNKLTVISCEQEENQDLGFSDDIMISGYIDMLLHDADGKDVIFDLKWTSKKQKYQNLVANNRAAQLALYQAMLQQHQNHPDAARTAFFIMPSGILVSADTFEPCHFEHIEVKNNDDLMEQLRQGYAKRKEEISGGYIETAEGMSLTDVQYANTPGVFPLESDSNKKTENKYSDYKCFTV